MAVVQHLPSLNPRSPMQSMEDGRMENQEQKRTKGRHRTTMMTKQRKKIP